MSIMHQMFLNDFCNKESSLLTRQGVGQISISQSMYSYKNAQTHDNEVAKATTAELSRIIPKENSQSKN